jgi:L-aspartate oxidase
MKRFDVAIIGSGLAGLTVALHLADHRKVGIFTKRELLDGASNWAQGGIAAVLAKDDSPHDHIRDTEIAGAGLCDPAITRYVVEHGREAIEWLIGQGVPFTRDTSDLGYHLTREGGHSHRRVIHAADATGHAVQSTLEAKIKAHPNICVLEQYMAVDLITADKLGLPDRRCVGVYCLDRQSGRVETVAADQVVLATGGAGKVYLYTTNPDTATGDGIAMGWRAGCRRSSHSSGCSSTRRTWKAPPPSPLSPTCCSSSTATRRPPIAVVPHARTSAPPGWCRGSIC